MGSANAEKISTAARKLGKKLLDAKTAERPKASLPAAVAAVVADAMPMHLSRKLIKPSPTNPRKTFPVAELTSLADSIRQVGIQQRLVVRARGRFKDKADVHLGVDHYEIVCGERRYRAAGIVGLDRIPVDIADLTDDQVRIIQVVENDQRADLVPSEQAIAYADLAERMTAEQIVEQTGKPLSFVRGVLKLANLRAVPEFLKALDEGRVPRLVAELVARVPGKPNMERLAAAVLSGCRYLSAKEPNPKPKKDDDPLTFRETRELIATSFQIELKTAPFSRSSLHVIPGNYTVTSCDACPKRAGNAAKEDAAYAEIRADVCLDPICYREKLAAHNAAVVDKAHADGRKLISKREAEKLFTSWGDHDLNYNAPYVDLDRSCHLDPKGRTYRSLLNGYVTPAKIAIAVDFAGNPHELVDRDEAGKILRMHHKLGVNTRSTSKLDEKYRKEQRERDAKARIGRAAAARANGLVSECIEHRLSKTLSLGGQAEHLLAQVAIGLIDIAWTDACRLVAKRRGLTNPDHKDAIKTLVPTLVTPGQLLGLIAELVAARRSLDWGNGGIERQDAEEKQFWTAFGVDRSTLMKLATAGKLQPPAASVTASAEAEPFEEVAVAKPAAPSTMRKPKGESKKSAEEQLQDMGLLPKPGDPDYVASPFSNPAERKAVGA
jgi:ParB/RepB/Spo0J family partition protein